MATYMILGLKTSNFCTTVWSQHRLIPLQIPSLLSRLLTSVSDAQSLSEPGCEMDKIWSHVGNKHYLCLGKILEVNFRKRSTHRWVGLGKLASLTLCDLKLYIDLHPS